MKWITAAALVLTMGGAAMAETNRIDGLRPDAPELARPGDHAIGVRTLELVHTGQPDVLGGGTYDRPLTVEVWYPATLGTTEPGGTYPGVQMANSTQTFSLAGRAVRDAQPSADEGPYPLVILSHGFPGNRFLISHFGESLATRGYVVASIDHFESTYENQLGFASTLANRSPDQMFVLDRLAAGPDFLEDMVDADNAAIIGYSMGGYGALISGGAGLSERTGSLGLAPAEALAGVIAGASFDESRDARIKAVVAIAPWGAQLGLWDEAGLAGIEVPLLLMGGTLDEVSGYEDGIRRVFEGAVDAPRHLLTFQGAGHNAAAPMPPPAEASESRAFEHYADFVWDNLRMNNVAQHFVTAFLDLHLKGETDKARFLELDGGDWRAVAGDRAWPGFGERTTRGLVFETTMP
jgi:predicted dienelactone hydrolase